MFFTRPSGLIRALGGWLADRMGGASITFWNFAVMAAAIFGTLLFLPADAYAGNVTGFYLLFLVVFVTAGIGNGSVFRVIPSVFHRLHRRWAANKDEAGQELAKHRAETETAVALGFSASIAAFGGFFIPIALAISSDLFGGPYFAIAAFGVSTLTCVLATWWWYFREGAEVKC